MQDLTTELKRYVNAVLGTDVRPVPWDGRTGLPFLLQDAYDFFETRLLGIRCLFMIDRNEGDPKAPGVIRKHMDTVERVADRPVVYVRNAVTSYNRKRLVEQKVSFIVPGNQMYLPMF